MCVCVCTPLPFHISKPRGHVYTSLMTMWFGSTHLGFCCKTLSKKREREINIYIYIVRIIFYFLIKRAAVCAAPHAHTCDRVIIVVRDSLYSFTFTFYRKHTLEPIFINTPPVFFFLTLLELLRRLTEAHTHIHTHIRVLLFFRVSWYRPWPVEADV